MNLISTNEAVERRAQKEFYEQAEEQMRKKTMEKLDFWRRVSLVYNPVIAVTFVTIYWIAGLMHAGYL